jgi:hypothetical protein
MNLKTNSLYSPNQPPKEENDTIYLINPTSEEFKTSYLDDSNKSIEVILAPLKSREFPTKVGKIILNHLIDFVLNQGGFSYKTDVNIEKARIRKDCVLYE